MANPARTYYQVSQGLWSPRYQAWGFGRTEEHNTLSEAKAEIKESRKAGFKGPLLLEMVTIMELSGDESPPSWATAKAVESLKDRQDDLGESSDY